MISSLDYWNSASLELPLKSSQKLKCGQLIVSQNNLFRLYYTSCFTALAVRSFLGQSEV